MPRVHKILAEEARVNAEAIVRWALQLHSIGKALGGKFEASDLQMDRFNNIKCAGVKKNILKNSTVKRKRKDFKKVRLIIKYTILGGQSEADLPQDLVMLLDLLKSYQLGLEVVIENHPGLMKEVGKIALFTRLFSQMEDLKAMDNMKFQQIITAIPYVGGSWRHHAYCNAHVLGVYGYLNRQASYADGTEGVLYLHRNCFQHLMKEHSTQKQAPGQAVVLFVYRQMEHMLGSLFPGFISTLLLELYRRSALGNVF
ncbi:hypothetical protein BS78_04G253800 [Paspalum vaginatum]|nr:hypothetical protein BS78_04G253800 [Paspalum vaginatum]